MGWRFVADKKAWHRAVVMAAWAGGFLPTRKCGSTKACWGGKDLHGGPVKAEAGRRVISWTAPGQRQGVRRRRRRRSRSSEVKAEIRRGQRPRVDGGGRVQELAHLHRWSKVVPGRLQALAAGSGNHGGKQAAGKRQAGSWALARSRCQGGCRLWQSGRQERSWAHAGGSGRQTGGLQAGGSGCGMQIGGRQRLRQADRRAAAVSSNMQIGGRQRAGRPRRQQQTGRRQQRTGRRRQRACKRRQL